MIVCPSLLSLFWFLYYISYWWPLKQTKKIEIFSPPWILPSWDFFWLQWLFGNSVIYWFVRVHGTEIFTFCLNSSYPLQRASFLLLSTQWHSHERPWGLSMQLTWLSSMTLNLCWRNIRPQKALRENDNYLQNAPKIGFIGRVDQKQNRTMAIIVQTFHPDWSYDEVNRARSVCSQRNIPSPQTPDPRPQTPDP